MAVARKCHFSDSQQKNKNASSVMQVNLNGYPQIFPTIILYYKLQIWRESNNFWITTSN